MVALSISPSVAMAGEEHGVVESANGIPVAVRAEFDGHSYVTTPCGRMGVVEYARPVGNVDVVLDPGHGGSRDTGAVAVTGLVERDLNLVVAIAAADELQNRGFDVLLTRSRDYASRLIARARLADASGAGLMLSIHHNAPTPGPSNLPGTEVFVQNNSMESARLGGLAWEDTVEELSQFDISWSAAADSGAMTVLSSRGTDAYGIIRYPATPTALLELGYLSNPAEARLFATEEYTVAAATAIANTAERFLTTSDTGPALEEGRVFNPNPGISSNRCEDPHMSGFHTFAEWTLESWRRLVGVAKRPVHE